MGGKSVGESHNVEMNLCQVVTWRMPLKEVSRMDHLWFHVTKLRKKSFVAFNAAAETAVTVKDDLKRNF